MSLTQGSTATSLTFQSPNQLSDQNSQGSELGASANDKVGFYGQSPIAQPTIGAAGYVARYGNGGQPLFDSSLLTKYQLTNATTAVPATSTAEVTTTVVTGVLATDVVAVNKPSATAGLGVAGYRAAAANRVGISYSNVSSAQLTTSAETYDVIGLSSTLAVTTALTPSAVPATTTSEQIFAVPGAVVGSLPVINKPTSQAGLGIGNARVVSEGQVAIQYFNNSSAAITPTSETYSIAFLPTLIPTSQTLVYNVQQASTAVAASSTADVTTAVTGLLTTDVVSGVSKPTYQAGLGVAGYRVSSAGNLAVTMVNVSSAATTTAETYAITVERTIAKAPLVVTTQTLTPVSVAANSTAEQTFAVNLLNASTSVLVSKPSHTPGISIVNARVSAASTLALTYQNNNSTAVVPPSEAYTIGSFPLQGPGAIATTGTSQSIQVPVSAQTSNIKHLHNQLIELGLMSAT